MESWKAGKFTEAIGEFNQCMAEGLVGREEILEFWKLVEVECEENAGVMINLYAKMKKVRGWSDETLGRELRISRDALQDVKSGRRPESEGVGLKMLYELFPHIAV